MRGSARADGDELARLIADQARDAGSDRVWSLSLDALPSGAEAPRRLMATDPRHGTEFLYQRERCRCAKCRKGHAAYRQARRLAGREPWQ